MTHVFSFQSRWEDSIAFVIFRFNKTCSFEHKSTGAGRLFNATVKSVDDMLERTEAISAGLSTGSSIPEDHASLVVEVFYPVRII